MERFSFKKRLKAFVYAYAGIKDAIQKEHNLWIHLVAIIITTSLGFYCGVNKYEWLVLIICFGAVVSAELMNTAVERVVDLSAEGKYHILAKQAKDIAAAAVMVLALMSVIIAVIIFTPYIKLMFS